MHGLVKSVPSGDSVLVIGSTTQVSAGYDTREARHNASLCITHFFLLAWYLRHNKHVVGGEGDSSAAAIGREGEGTGVTCDRTV